MKKLFAALIATAAVPAFAQGLDLTVSNDTVGLRWNSAVMANNTSVELGWVHNNEDEQDVVTAGFFVNGTRGEVSGRLGGKLYGADLDFADGYGVAVGGDAALTVTSFLTLSAAVYISPDPLSFGDMEGYEEYSIAANFEVLQNAVVTVGYGTLELDTEQRNGVEVLDGVFVGMNLRF